MLCRSGAAGFCPEPHLHIQAHLVADAAAAAPSPSPSPSSSPAAAPPSQAQSQAQPSIPIAFRAADGATFSPRAGYRYGGDMIAELG